jgi:hypothetical protein
MEIAEDFPGELFLFIIGDVMKLFMLGFFIRATVEGLGSNYYNY